MGQEAEAAVRRKAFADYQVNEKLVALAKRNVNYHALAFQRIMVKKFRQIAG